MMSAKRHSHPRGHPRGVVAAGNRHTAEAAEQILRAGGNAFDAAVAALATACVAETALASLGGGGFLLALPAEEPPRLYDFFAHTPRRRRPAQDVEFHPILADFGPATQEFHIGRGAAAVPGVVRGLFAVHRDLGTVPMPELVAPAAALAGRGLRLTPYQAYLLRVLAPIFRATPECVALYGNPQCEDGLLAAGDLLRLPRLADTLETLAREGEDLFYRGEIAALIARDMAAGGHLDRGDLERYAVERRAPLEVRYRDTRLLTNPPPSSGGLLVALALGVLEAVRPERFGDPAHLESVVDAMALASEARLEALAASGGSPPAEAHLLDAEKIAAWRAQVAGRARASRGTTQVSIIDAAGNLASLSVSNGEGAGYVVPGTDIVLNNMLGEEDLNPDGFHRWAEDQRLTSMMAPTAALTGDGRRFATGSGGSNRIRSAILQVLVGLLDFRMPVDAAVDAPRVHLEGDFLSVEGGFDPADIDALLRRHPSHQVWEDRNMFFGGAHTAVRDHRGALDGAGDRRREGVCLRIGA